MDKGASNIVFAAPTLGAIWAVVVEAGEFPVPLEPLASVVEEGESVEIDGGMVNVEELNDRVGEIVRCMEVTAVSVEVIVVRDEEIVG